MPKKETVVQKFGDKGKRPITKPLHSNDSIPSSSKLASNPNINVKPIPREEKPLAMINEPKENTIEKSPSAFNIQKKWKMLKSLSP